MSWDPAVNRQEAIETACHNAIHAIHGEAKAALSEQRSFDDRLALTVWELLGGVWLPTPGIPQRQVGGEE